jgi:hypothetical protein
MNIGIVCCPMNIWNNPISFGLLEWNPKWNCSWNCGPFLLAAISDVELLCCVILIAASASHPECHESFLCDGRHARFRVLQEFLRLPPQLQFSGDWWMLLTCFCSAVWFSHGCSSCYLFTALWLDPYRKAPSEAPHSQLAIQIWPFRRKVLLPRRPSGVRPPRGLQAPCSRSSHAGQEREQWRVLTFCMLSVLCMNGIICMHGIGNVAKTEWNGGDEGIVFRWEWYLKGIILTLTSDAFRLLKD